MRELASRFHGRDLGHSRAIAESLAVPVTCEMISEQKCDETKPTCPLTASECPLLVETPVRPHALGNRPTLAQAKPPNKKRKAAKVAVQAVYTHKQHTRSLSAYTHCVIVRRSVRLARLDRKGGRFV